MRKRELLFPEVFDRKALEQLRHDLGEAAYNAQILQRPTPPGGHMFQMKHFQRYENRPLDIEMIVQSWDVAFTEEDHSNYTACTTWGIAGRKLYLLDVLRKRMKFFQVPPAIVSHRQKHKARFVILETAGVGKAVAQELQRLSGVKEWLLRSEPKESKEERALAQTPKLERKRVYLPASADWLSAFESEVAAFPFGRHDDQVDSMVQFLRALDFRNLTRHLWAFRLWPNCF